MNKGFHLALLCVSLIPSFVPAQSAPTKIVPTATDSKKSAGVLTAKGLLAVWDKDKSNTLTADELPKVINRSHFVRLDENANWVLTVNELRQVQAELDAAGQLKKLHVLGIRIPLSDVDRVTIRKARGELLEAMKKRRLKDLGS